MIWKRVGRKLRGEVQVDLLPWQMHEAYLQELEDPRGATLTTSCSGPTQDPPSPLPLSCRPKAKELPRFQATSPQTSLSSLSFYYLRPIEP